MLIFKVVDDKKIKKKKFSKKKKSIYPIRNNVFIDNKQFTIIALGLEDFENPSIKKLLEINKGNVLKSNNDRVNEIVGEYLFDINGYIKKSYIASLVDIIKMNPVLKSICFKDSSFTAYKEYLDLAAVSRKLVLIADENKAMNSFRDYCINNFGLSVYLEKYKSETYDVFVDLDMIYNNRNCFADIKGERIGIKPSENYFKITDSVDQLLDNDVALEWACAALSL